MIDRLEFVDKWQKAFGCNSSGICWCNTCTQLESLYDWFVEEVVKDITDHAEPRAGVDKIE